MKAIQLRTENLSLTGTVVTEKKVKNYKVIPVSPEIKKWRGCASFTDAEIENDPRLKAILSR